MSTTSRTFSSASCPVWIYGPQVSDMNVNYGVGGKTWGTLYKMCKQYMASKYGDFSPEYISQKIDTDSGYFEVIAKMSSKLKDSTTILDILLIHSAFINAFGVLMLSRYETALTRLKKAYDELYKMTYTIVGNSYINLFLVPEEFNILNDSRKNRKKNILIGKTPQQIIDTYPLIKTSSPAPFKCGTELLNDCTAKFETIKNPLFKPLADIIACNCSFFKQKLIKIKSTDTTFENISLSNKISVGDYNYLMNAHEIPDSQKKPPILVKKYSDNIKQCSEKNYLSQLFEKTCSILFKPYYIKAKKDDPDYIIEAAKENIIIANSGCRTYSMGHLSVFGTPILFKNKITEMCNIPVYFVLSREDDREKVYDDRYAGPSKQFYTDVIKELLDHEVFKASQTFFNNQRFELNKGFDVEKLECYSRLPAAIKTPEFKKQITDYFFIFVGNLIHFAVVNNIELPFKLSRVYILKLFNIIDFLKSDKDGALKILSPKNTELKLLFISIYLLEKSPPIFTNAIIKIMENPTQETLSEKTILDILDPELLTENASIRLKGARMNGIYDILKEDRHIYSSNEKELFSNIVDLICKKALIEYFGNMMDISPIDNSFKIHNNLDNFFTGFKYYKNYENPLLTPMPTADFSKVSFEHKLGIIRKIDIFLSGFGVSYEIIKNSLIPLITIPYYKTEPIQDDAPYSMHPLYLFNKEGLYDDAYITNMDLDTTEENNILKEKLNMIKKGVSEGKYKNASGSELAIDVLIRHLFLLFRILLNRGQNLSPLFVERYNEKFYNKKSAELASHMSAEDYHNEFVKLLLKSWSSSPTITPKGYIFDSDIVLRENIPTIHTCFNQLTLKNEYKTAAQLYKDLIILITTGTNYGEVYGGKKKIRSKKR